MRTPRTIAASAASAVGAVSAVKPGGNEPTPATLDAPSKTQRKKEMQALQTLGLQLVELNPEQFARLDLPEALREAVEFAQRVTSHEGRRRHMQYLGKLMRQVDGEAIRAALARVTGDSRAAVSLMHRAEAWRQRLLEDDAALTAFVAEQAGADVQWLRSAIRAARRERDLQQAPKHARELYRYLHRALEDQLREKSQGDAG